MTLNPPEGYAEGGYHPIRVGDRLAGRDEKIPSYIAVKVGTAASTHKEAGTLTLLAGLPLGGPSFGKRLVPSILDDFEVEGPNGTHPCFATTPALCSLADAREAGRHTPFRMDVARSISAQLAIAVSCMHSVGLVHGDLHIKNLLLQQVPPGIDNLTEEQPSQRYGPPEPERVEYEDGTTPSSPGVPAYVYVPIWMGKPGNEMTLDEVRILVSDYGTAFFPGEERRFDSYTPLPIRPPEARFEPAQPLGSPSDIWSLGCTIWQVLGLKPFFGGGLFSQNDATKSQIDALGALPDEWWDRWEGKAKTESFVGNGVPRPGRDVWTFDQRFEDCIQTRRRDDGVDTMADDERDALVDMVRRMLRFRPDERITADQVLETKWMKRWAVPEAMETWGEGGCV